jgi:hypothetical protein
MTLHEAIAQLLAQRGTPMTTTDIAEALNKNSWYSKKDGSAIQPFQIHGRTKNYPHLFVQNGSTISLKSATGILPMAKQPVARRNPVAEMSKDAGLLLKMLMNEKNFRPVKELDGKIPDEPGLYCVRVRDGKLLPPPFSGILNDRKHNIIYIGIASQSLSKRFWGQELRAKGHGTFFRSLGAVLGYRPEPESLKDKKNQNNYRFSSANESKIIEWIDQNLLVNWVVIGGDLNSIEARLIHEHLPLLNIAGNPLVVPTLQAWREECKRIGRGDQH